jgi:hypothetical protein
MQAGLLPNPAVPAAGPTDPASGMDLRITMLDGGLGAVTDPSVTVAATADMFCFCDCTICKAPPPIEAVADNLSSSSH